MTPSCCPGRDIVTSSACPQPCPRCCPSCWVPARRNPQSWLTRGPRPSRGTGHAKALNFGPTGFPAAGAARARVGGTRDDDGGRCSLRRTESTQAILRAQIASCRQWEATGVCSKGSDMINFVMKKNPSGRFSGYDSAFICPEKSD